MSAVPAACSATREREKHSKKSDAYEQNGTERSIFYTYGMTDVSCKYKYPYIYMRESVSSSMYKKKDKLAPLLLCVVLCPFCSMIVIRNK